MPDQIKVIFQPAGLSAYVLAGTKVLEAAGQAGLTIDTPCGGAGLCGKCRVKVIDGTWPAVESELKFFSADEIKLGWRLACQSKITKPATIEIPETSIFASQQRIVTETTSSADHDLLPAVRKIYVELPPPTLADSQADLLRLERAVGHFDADLGMLHLMGGLLPKLGYKGTAVLADHKLIDFEQGDTSDKCYGVAFDIGTTTLAGSLVDLKTGRQCAIASAINPQASMGDDVLSRINFACASAENLCLLRSAILGAITTMLQDLASQAGVPAGWIYEICFAGNTTMQHLLCGIDVASLGAAPFAPTCGRGLLIKAAELGLPIHPRAVGYVFPIIGGFVGGDTVAGIVSTNLIEQESPALMVDIGTNGEIVLACNGELTSASTAAGPAFEGARISCGRRATTGAIEKVILDNDVEMGVIGNVAPKGLCGSGLIDLAAELLRVGILSPTGRILGGSELPASLPQALQRRVRPDAAGQLYFVLAEGTQNQPMLCLTQRDVRELQLACGAIRAGINILLKQAHLRSSDLKLVMLAGGFGSFIRRNHAQRLGLLPADIEHHKIHYVGNASLGGARWALVSTQARQEAQRLASLTRHVELSRDADFQDEFADAMIFPNAGPA
jgi:uncharacterized 2Fe-2S/4Fe-4S cluster protein (DUF4445 family)